MNQPNTKSIPSETSLVIRLLAKKLGTIFLRWTLGLTLGLITWVLFDALPPVFCWFIILTMLASMSIHTVLHRKENAPLWAKQACRYAFFLSIPMLFVFAGNRLAVWSVADVAGTSVITTPISNVEGAIPSADYLLFKELQKEHFKDSVKTKKGFKKILSNQLTKAKEMDKATKVILIVLGVILLLVIILIFALISGIQEGFNCLAGG